jgi:hypothetical protein
MWAAYTEFVFVTVIKLFVIGILAFLLQRNWVNSRLLLYQDAMEVDVALPRPFPM